LVAGTISAIHPEFEDGAFFNQGDILAELDPTDFETEQLAAQSRLARAEAALAQEEARAKQAALNWQDIGYSEEPSPLVLRVPQLKEARAAVTAARAELDKATRNLERTRIRAPFDGRVKSRIVGLGQSVGGTTALGEVFATDFAEIRLPLAARQLAFVNLPGGPDDPPLNVTLTDALAEDQTEPRDSWQARIVRTEGTLDDASRELFAIARIDDPFGRESGNPELRIGQPVRASIEGVVLKDVYIIPRNAMRGINRIYLIDKQELRIKRTEIEPVFSNSEEVVLRDGVSAGDWLATSRLPYAPNGAPVEIIESAVVAETPEPLVREKGSGS
jgi:RND family efflux transporter MFP subunit